MSGFDKDIMDLSFPSKDSSIDLEAGSHHDIIAMVDYDDLTYEPSDEDVTRILIAMEARIGSRARLCWSDIREQDKYFFGKEKSFRDTALKDEFLVLQHKSNMDYLFVLDLWGVTPGYQTVLEQRAHWVAAHERYFLPPSSGNTPLRRVHSWPTAWY